MRLQSFRSTIIRGTQLRIHWDIVLYLPDAGTYKRENTGRDNNDDRAIHFPFVLSLHFSIMQFNRRPQQRANMVGSQWNPFSVLISGLYVPRNQAYLMIPGTDPKELRVFRRDSLPAGG